MGDDEGRARRDEKAGVVRLSKSPYSSPVVLVKKKDGSLHFCVDYWKLNTQTKPDTYPLPMVGGVREPPNDSPNDPPVSVGQMVFNQCALARQKGLLQKQKVDPIELPLSSFSLCATIYSVEVCVCIFATKEK